MLTIMEALRIMSDYFEDDKDGFKVRLEQFRDAVGLKHFAEDFHEGKPISDSYSLDEILKDIGLKLND
jgi:hypothetical protein